MSDPLPGASAAGELDWKLVAAAAATFLATMLTTVWGWIQGRKKSTKAAEPQGPQYQVAAAVLQDNLSLRENTTATRDLRDQIVLLIHTLDRHVKVQDDMQDSLDDLIKRLDKVK
jgi:hypothetical protein